MFAEIMLNKDLQRSVCTMNRSVTEEDLNLAIVNVVKKRNGIEKLCPS